MELDIIWDEAKQNNFKSPLLMSLEGVKGHENIVSVWKKHHEKLLKSYSNDSKICKIDTESTNYSCTSESLLPNLCDKSMLKQLTF